MDYQKLQQRFGCLGVDISHPVDSLPPGKYPFLENLRVYQEGILTSRVGLSKVNSTVLPDLNIHTIGHLNDYVTNTFVRLLAAGTNLYRGLTSFTNVLSGLDGNPVSFCSYRPEQSPDNYSYVANGAKLAKIPATGNAKNMGVFPPTKIPTAEMVYPHRNFDTQTETIVGPWASHGAASSFAYTQRLTGVTVNGIIDFPAYGGGFYTFVIPYGGNFQNISPGMRIYFDRGGGNQDDTTIEEVHKINGDPGVIASISFDDVGAGAPYLVTVQPTAPTSGIARNAALFLGSEMVRVISVTNSPEGLTSFRCLTNDVHTPGEVITAPAAGNFFAVTNFTHSNGESLTSVQLDFTVTPVTPGDPASVSFNYFPNVFNFGVAQGRPIGPDDYVHLSFKVDNPSALVEANLVIDVDPSTSNIYAATDGTKNAFTKSFKANDFQAIVENLQPADVARTKAIQLQLQNNTQIGLATNLNPTPAYGSQGSTPIDTPIIAQSNPLVSPLVSSTSQISLGNSQWTEFFWKIADLVRIGTAQIADLSDIRAIQLRITANSVIHVSFANLWMGGTFGPDTNIQLTPLIYRFRYRDSSTGAKSIPGPAMRTGINVMRQGVFLTLAPSTDPQVDKIDVERLGAELLDWHYVGTCDNNVAEFVDDQYSAAVQINSALDTDAYMPFPLSDVPYTSVVSVIGTAVEWVSGPVFNTAWARGTVVLLNGRVTSLYASPTSTTLMHITDSLGSDIAASIVINEPILQGQPLPVMWGPWRETLFGCGSDLLSGGVFFTKGSDPDSAPLPNFVEVTTPNEMMMNGCLYDSRNFAYSDKRMFYILPGGINGFELQEVANSKGLFARWALTVGPKIWFLSQDGIYESDGGTPVCISDDINTMFPSGDRPGFLSNGFYPVQMDNSGSGTQQGNLRLEYSNGYVFFDYIDTNGTGRVIVYDTLTKGWYPDLYGISGRLVCHHQENSLDDNDEHFTLLAGGSNGYLYTHSGFSDDGAAIQTHGRTPSFDTGDIRALKIWADYVLDTAMGGVTLSVTPYINDYATALPTTTLTSTTRVISNPIDISSGAGTFGRNLGIDFSWSSGSVRPQIFAWTPSYLVRPDNTFKRADDWEDGGYGGAKLVRGFVLEADTDSVVKGFNLEGDQAILKSFSQTFNGNMLLPFDLNPPIIASLLRIHPTENVVWRKFRVSYIYDKYPENSKIVLPYSNDGNQGDKYITGAIITALGTDSAAQIKIGGAVNGPVLNLQHPGATLSTKPYAFEPPFIAHELSIYPSTAIRIDGVKWIWEPLPENAAIQTPYANEGTQGAKFVQGALVTAMGADPSAQVIYDGGYNGPVMNLQHPGTFLSTVPYSFTTPFVAHELAITPSTAIRIASIKWVWEPMPELAQYWETQGTAHGINGWQFLKDGYIAYISNVTAVLTINVDGVDFAYNLPSTGGLFSKIYLIFGKVGATNTGLKGKIFTYSIVAASNDFRLFKKDCEVRVHQWGGAGYQVFRPFGGQSFQDGAAI